MSVDTFVELTKLEQLDLSYNHLQYIQDNQFESNNKLKTLNLAGNNFMYLQNEPFLISKSIEVSLLLSIMNLSKKHTKNV